MRRQLHLLPILTIAAAALPARADVRASFDDLLSDSTYAIQYEGPGAPGAFRGAMVLIEGLDGENGSIVFDRAHPADYSRIQSQWRMRMTPNGHGMGLLLFPPSPDGVADEAPSVQHWEEPNLAGGFGIGFDTHNPPGGTPFDTRGNIYDRPQREVSLHLDGVEIANTLAPAEFAAGEWVTVDVEIAFVPGGANVTVRFGDDYVYDDAFVPTLLPFEARIALGARSDAGASSPLALDDIAVRFIEPLDAPPADPIRVVAFDRELITAHQQRAPGTADFRHIPEDFRGRVIATLTLAAPAGGLDPRARPGAFSIFSHEHERFEVFRFVTPFGRGGMWRVDVTHLLPLLSARRPVELRIDTEENGWLASVQFDFFSGEMRLIPFQVINLWQGEPEIGNLAEPVNFFYNQRRIVIDPRTDAAFIHTTVTGHGQLPNSDNAAEFMPIERTITVRDGSFTNLLWTTDNYLNPIRPQGGAWKYDRAGWGPGRVVTPWVLDVSRYLFRAEEAAFDYELAPYQNLNRVNDDTPFHWTESQLVLYELAEPLPQEYVCQRASGPIDIDGILSEDSWEEGDWIILDRDIRGRAYHLPRHPTVAALRWDDERLYVAARMVEPHVNAAVKEHDAIVYLDNDFEIFLDPGGDGVNYAEVEINALNTVLDIFIDQPYLDGGAGDLEWTWTGMESAVHVAGTLNNPSDRDQEWMIEMSLPWSALRDRAGVALPPRPGDRWGMNLARVQWKFDFIDGEYVKNESRAEDNWVWTPIGTVNIHHPTHWGVLVFE